MRLTARSRSIVASIPQNVPDELYESGDGAEHQEDHIQKVRAEGLVEQITDDVSDEGRNGKKERQ